MADNYNLEDGLKKLIIENTYVLLSDKDFTEYSDLITDFGYDSLSIIRLIADIERTFNIEFEIKTKKSCDGDSISLNKDNV